MTTTQKRIYVAGQDAAIADRSRGMAISTMSSVPQPTDNRYWAAGYRLMIAWLQDGRHD